MKSAKKGEKSPLKEVIVEQKEAIAHLLEPPMRGVARRCADHWGKVRALNSVLADGYGEIPYSHLFYVLDVTGIQVSANVYNGRVDRESEGQNLADRPYMQDGLPLRGVSLSPVYVSRITSKPCITAIYPVTEGNRLLGLLMADINLRELPVVSDGYQERRVWRQIKGDPAIRGTLFMQERVLSAFDQNAESVMANVEELFCARGVFHVKIHYSSSRASLWLTADPYNYRIIEVEDLIRPDICLAYPLAPYPSQAVVSPDAVRVILERFRALRTVDEQVYLRASSINVINGMVLLTFSCDGSHYLTAAEFLEKPLAFWMGAMP